jgi:hypothetical protein
MMQAHIAAALAGWLDYKKSSTVTLEIGILARRAVLLSRKFIDRKYRGSRISNSVLTRLPGQCPTLSD